jgi:hypothetical protein
MSSGDSKKSTLSSDDDSNRLDSGTTSVSVLLSYAISVVLFIVNSYNFFTSVTVVWWNSEPCTDKVLNASYQL